MPKFEYLWSESKLRELHRRQLIILTIGVPFPFIYSLFLPPETPYRLFLGLVPFVAYLPIDLFNFFSLNRPNQGPRFILTYLNTQTSAILIMAVTGGFRSPLQFIPMIIMFLAGIFIGPIASTIVFIYTIFLFVGLYLWLLYTQSGGTVITQDFLLNLAIFCLVSIIQRGVGKELSLQFEARKKLEQVDDLKNQFISLSSHYLRTPIAVIRAFTGDLEKTSLNSQQTDDLRGINTNIEKLTQLIDKFLAISSIERGEAKINTSLSDIVKLVNSVVSEYKKEADAHQVIFSSKEPTDLIPNFYFDAVKLHQAFASVIDNAIRYNRPGGYVMVSIKRDGDSIMVRVEDTGFGIKKDQLENLFTTFNVGGMEKVLTMDKVNVGLNLYLTKLIIESHKGKILLESEENKGSIVTITIPMVFEGAIS